MIKKECRDTLRTLLESSILLLALPIIQGLSLLMQTNFPFWDLLKINAIITVGAFAIYSGLSMFQSERKDKGFEYLLTLPMSKIKLLMNKMLPRLVVLVTVGTVTGLLLGASLEKFLLAMLILHLGTVFLSLPFQSLLGAFVTFIVLVGIYGMGYTFFNYLFFEITTVSFNPYKFFNPVYLAAIILLAPLGISFGVALKKLDLKPFAYALRPYLFIALPIIMSEVAVIAYYYNRFGI
jgi:hypothetical protein